MTPALADEMILGMDDMGGICRARSTDPLTSHAAAASAECFAHTHAGRILAVLRYEGSGTAEHIAQFTGLTVVQIDRRMVELQRQGLVRVPQLGGDDLVRNGFRVWEIA